MIHSPETVIKDPGIQELRVADSELVTEIHDLGAYIRTLRAGDIDLLYSYHPISDGRTRGGSFATPLFGPKAVLLGAEKQHTFSRDHTWMRGIAGDDNELVHILENPAQVNPKVNNIYDQLTITQVASFTSHNRDHFLDLVLTARNNGVGDVPFAPGFHPYFALGEGTSADQLMIRYGNEKDGVLQQFAERKFSEQELLGTQFISEDSERGKVTWVEFNAGNGYRVRVYSEDLNIFAIWTDNPGKYICVEPTLAGADYTPEDCEPHQRVPKMMERGLAVPPEGIKTVSAKVAFIKNEDLARAG